MKKILLLVTVCTAFIFTMNAQAPEGFKYQAVVRDAGNNILTSQAVGIRLTIQQGAPGGTAVYTETFSPTTNTYGLVNLEIGTGTTTDDFSTIDWANGPYFMETAIDPTGGTAYTVMGTSQLMSVPYALYSKNSADAFSGDYNDLVNTPILSMSNDTIFLTNGGYVVLPTPGGGGNWSYNGNNLYNNNLGYKVGVGTTTPAHIFDVADTLCSVGIGYVGSFNHPESGRLVFSEDINFSGDCGIMFQHNGASNDLYLLGGCTTFSDTIARFNRNAYANIKRLRLGGTDMNVNTTNPLSVIGNTDFNGNVTITGNLNVTGNLSKGAGTFKIDHPLDPANKYLIHSFVESPDMMNIYNGNIITDADGFATVQLPDYFEAANKDFRYQLTVIGTFAQAIVKEKINGNTFVIQTNIPNVEVSWQVTGVRADKFSDHNRVISEVDKEIKGTYLHPELYGEDADKSEYSYKVKLELEKQDNQNSNDLDK